MCVLCVLGFLRCLGVGIRFDVGCLCVLLGILLDVLSSHLDQGIHRIRYICVCVCVCTRGPHASLRCNSQPLLYVVCTCTLSISFGCALGVFYVF